MTDSVRCTGLYGSEFGIQLTRSALYISLRGQGGVKAAIFRYGDTAPLPLRLASQMEKDVSALIMEGADFDAVRSTPRLRVRVMTVLDDIRDFDLDLTDLAPTYEFLGSSQCQGTGKP
jgi:hypothetical protein